MAYAVGHRVAVALPVMLNYTALQCESLASPARARAKIPFAFPYKKRAATRPFGATCPTQN